MILYMFLFMISHIHKDSYSLNSVIDHSELNFLVV